MGSWLRLSVFLAFALPVIFGDGAGYARPVSAESLVGSSQECGTYVWHTGMNKGRTDGMVARSVTTVGCFTYDFQNIIGADASQMASNPERERAWQTQMCIRDAREQIVGHFRYYRGVEVDPASISVTCTPYQGPD